MSESSVFTGFAGLGTGYQYTYFKAKEDEVKKGGNTILASFPLMGQVACVADVINRVSQIWLREAWRGTVSLISNVLPFVAIPLLLVSGIVKQGHYTECANAWNLMKHRYMPGLPTTLSPFTVKVHHFLSDHLGKIIKVAMIVGTVALIALGQTHFAYGMLAGIAYHTLDTSGWIPRKISLFIEKYMTVILMAGGLGSTVYANRILTAVVIPTYLLPMTAMAKVHAVFERCIRLFAKSLKGPTLQDFDRPATKINRKMSYEEMMKILNGNESDYEVDPSHTAKCCTDALKEKSFAFDDYMTILKKINWEAKHNVVKLKFKDDDRFHDFLVKEYNRLCGKDIEKPYLKGRLGEVLTALADGQTEEFYANTLQKFAIKHPRGLKDEYGEVKIIGYKRQEFHAHLLAEYKKAKGIDLTEQDLFGHFDEVLKAVVEKKNVTEAKFFAEHMERQMNGMVKYLKGKDRPDGEQVDLEDTIDYCSKILPQIQRLDPKKKSDAVKLEDVLLRLSVEGGEYCARGLKTASFEVACELQGTHNADGTPKGPLDIFEDALTRELQKLRSKNIHDKYKLITKDILKLPASVRSDTHAFDVYKWVLSLGFYPLSKNERNKIDLGVFTNWALNTNALRNDMLAEYRYDMLTNYNSSSGKREAKGNDKEEDAKEKEGITSVRVTDYLRNIVQDNNKLTSDQKGELLDRMTDVYDHRNCEADSIRLMLVMNGKMRRIADAR